MEIEFDPTVVEVAEVEIDADGSSQSNILHDRLFINGSPLEAFNDMDSLNDFNQDGLLNIENSVAGMMPDLQIEDSVQECLATSSPVDGISVIKKVIVVNPGDDCELAMAKAREDLRQSLDRDYSERILRGEEPPEKEILIEITSIVSTADHKVNVRNHRLQSLPVQHPEESFRTPSPTGRVARARVGTRMLEEICDLENADCYFQSDKFEPRRKPVSPLCLTARRIGLKSLDGNNLELSPSSTVEYDLDNKVRRLKACLSDSTSSVSYSEEPNAGDSGFYNASRSFSDVDVDGPDPKLTNSLTNMDWLESVDGDQLPHCEANPMKRVSTDNLSNNNQCKRPPHSYMELIQMALSSTVDFKMTLREIYQWIENKFTYYKCLANKGWKNSIRHNLSLYDIFVRKKSMTRGHLAASYWTMRTDHMTPATNDNVKQNQYKLSSIRTQKQASVLSLRSVAMKSAHRNSPHSNNPLQNQKIASRKGLVPLLPKPTPVQTCTLIPIQRTYRVENPAVRCSSTPNQGFVQMNGFTSVKRIGSNSTDALPRPKIVRSMSQRDAGLFDPTNNGEVSCGSDSLSASLNTSQLRQQLSHMSVDARSVTCASELITKQDRTKSNPEICKGLPKPKLYRHHRRKQELKVLRSPSDGLIREENFDPERLPSAATLSTVLHETMEEVSLNTIRDSDEDEGNIDRYLFTPFMHLKIPGSTLLSPIKNILTPKRLNSDPGLSQLSTPPGLDSHCMTSTPRSSTPNHSSFDEFPTPGKLDVSYIGKGLFDDRSFESSQHNDSLAQLFDDYIIADCIIGGLDISDLNFSTLC